MSTNIIYKNMPSLFFPFFSWIRGYRIGSFRGDFIAGITVAAVLIPQSMAYAMLAGMPPVYGLYAATIPSLIGALWGSLRQLATGPIAITSLLVLSTLTPFAEPGTASYIELAFILSFMVGILYLGIGLLHLGQLMSFISHSAVKGFTSAVALIIIATQIPHFLGTTISRHEFILPMLLEIVRKLPSTHIPTFVMGLAAFSIIYSIKKYRPNFPSGLLAIVITSIVVFAFQLHDRQIAVVGMIPKGLPFLNVPFSDFYTISSLIGPSVVIALVSFAETYSVGKALSAQSKQKVNVDQELIGQGMANLAGSFFQSYPVSGSFSRSAINYACGAKTGISSVTASLIVALALLFLTPLFTYIPKATLAALIISAVLLLFHPKEIIVLWKMNRDDGIVASIVFVMALVTKPDYALLIGVMSSLIFFLWKTMHPCIVRVAKDPERNIFVNGDISGKPSCPQLVHLRSDNCIFFANAEYTVEQLLKRVDEHQTPVRFLLLDFQAVGFIDITGTDELRVLNDELKTRSIQLALMNVHLPVIQVFKSSGFIKEVDPEFIITNEAQAITSLFPHFDHSYCKEICPYEIFYECPSVK
ncbi:MAG: SulP family inorganic anion transporter [Desulfobacterales bacterium]|nr:SulP family inorganic anion transporter [Desulfobacterales bacterium]